MRSNAGEKKLAAADSSDLSEKSSTSRKGGLGNKIRESYIWQSIFRHDHLDTPRGRSLTTFSNFFLHIHPVKVKRHTLKFTHTFCLGGISLLLFLILAVTGLYLMFFYVPSITEAYNDVRDLQSRIYFGQLMRNIHRWSAHLMVLTVILHMLRVFYRGAYKPPREFNWVIGVGLLVVTLLFSFTGYLLPWDQLSYWAVTVGTNIASYAPLIGKEIRMMLLGEPEVGANALLRFYVLHVYALPAVIVILMAIHFWRIRKDGGISGGL